MRRLPEPLGSAPPTARPGGGASGVGAGIRAFDPCLSFSTHAYGDMPLRIELREVDGSLVDSVTRG